MKRIFLFAFCIVALAAAFLLSIGRASAQSSFAERRITQAIDETKLTVLRGNTHPAARPQADQGPAPADLRMDHMTLVLTPSPDQSTALSKLLHDQQDPSSPSYHKWLTPDEYGEQFGANEGDIQTVTSWLGSHGFSVDQVTRGRTLVQFSGTAANVKEAFHTEIHKYLVKGQEHWANASDPQIPTALTPVVAGVATLHDFHRKPMNHRVGSFSMNRVTRQVRPLKPQFNFGSGCGLENGTCFLVGPGDFAKIYGVPTASSGGSDVTIAIVGDSEINLSDATNFYSIFGISRSAPVEVVPPGAESPGVQSCANGGDECEADIDTQWAGAIAPGAVVCLVVAANTNAANGVDLAAEAIVNGTVSCAPAPQPPPQILSESFGTCESALGSAGNQMFGGANGDGGLWGQAASEGISVLISAGDSGSSGCESPNPNDTGPQPAITGLAVSGLASTWNNTSVGGTDFNQFKTECNFWNCSNSPNSPGTQVSVDGPIGEITWNDSCTNILFTTPGLGFDSTVQANCNFTQVTPSFIVPEGGGGGPSSCAVTVGAGCTGYGKPAYQSALTSALDNFRDQPDISLFAGTGLVGSFYPVCVQDLDPENPPNHCSISTDVPFDIQGFGGTSVSTQAFAGIVALLVQHKGGSGLGLLNTRLYALAGTPANVCASSSSPPAGCIFNDVVNGTTSQPCVLTSPDCSGTSNAVAIPPMRNVSRASAVFIALACISFFGILLLGLRLKDRNWGAAFALLVFALFLTCAACGGGSSSSSTPPPANTNGILTGWPAQAGYDEATGLGSVNVQALINSF
jgi:Pro-kumamolisin, activation domain